jgi:hypothetical protein
VKLKPAKLGIVQRHRTTEDEVEQDRRHEEEAERDPEDREDVAGLFLPLVRVAAEGPDRDERKQEDGDEDARIRPPDRTGHEDAAVGDGHGIEQDHRRACVLPAEIARLRRRFGHDREDHEDPQEQRDVAEAFDIDGHQAGDEPVVGQAQDAGEDAEDGRDDTAQEGDEQRVQDPHDGRAAMGRVVGVFDQALVDVIAGGCSGRRS